jgi:2-C-methyl-D-erythritol 2,4-cyclodiphosphate synthase
MHACSASCVAQRTGTRRGRCSNRRIASGLNRRRYPLIIGGIDVPHTRGCVAHSDGDVLLHCITDALLGALCLPDIGQLFPDSDPKWKVGLQRRLNDEVLFINIKESVLQAPSTRMQLHPC